SPPFIATPPTAIYALSLHDALPIFAGVGELCGRHDHLLSPLKQSPDADCLRAHMIEPRLDNGEMDLPDVIQHPVGGIGAQSIEPDRKSTRLNSSHVKISYAVFCLKK